MSKEKHIFDLSRCPHPMSEEFVLMDDDLYYTCDKYEEYTERATAVPRGEEIDSTIPCDCQTKDGRFCDGTVQLKRLDLPSEIHWKCQKCGDHGAIINFEDTYWDLSNLSAQEKEEYLNADYSDIFDDFDELGADDPFAAQFESLVQEMSEQGFGDAINEFFNRFDRQILEETAGLSAADFARLFSGNWEEPGAPLHIRDDISYKDASKSMIFCNARTFLQILADHESFTATQAGNLKRKTVSELMEAFRWPAGYLDKMKEYNKVINERDIWKLHTIRVLLDLSGLIQQQKGSFLPVKKRLHLIEEAHAGELFQRLFVTYFVKMNMAYRGGGFGVEYMQDGLPYSFYRLSLQDDAWASTESLYEAMLLPAVKQQLESRTNLPDYNPGISTLEYDLLKPLVEFGVLEERETGEKDALGYKDKCEYRKTPLFDKVVTFNL